jgi:hypothetical protein
VHLKGGTENNIKIAELFYQLSFLNNKLIADFDTPIAFQLPLTPTSETGGREVTGRFKVSGAYEIPISSEILDCPRISDELEVPD